jgi:putative glycosyltransferase (TIGR04372 family)
MRKKILDHHGDVKAFGFAEVVRKTRVFILNILYPFTITLALAPFVLIVIILRPIVWFRFGVMRSDRFGHFIADVEVYLCERDRLQTSKKIIDIIGCPTPTCNSQLERMWRRNMRITPGGSLWDYFRKACEFWSQSEKNSVRVGGLIENYSLILNSRAHLSFTSTEIQQGIALLRKLGIPPDHPWICIHNRDQTYLETVSRGKYGYHSYRDFSVNSLTDAAEEWSSQGYYVLRMGAKVAEKLLVNNAKIIDYASSALRSDFADMFLYANCAAHFGGDSGAFMAAYVFKKPVSLVNASCTAIEAYLNLKLDMPFIFKRLRYKSSQKLLSLREVYSTGLMYADMTSKFEAAGVEWIDNSSNEIKALAIEVHERLSGRWQANSFDQYLQDKFWNKYGELSELYRMGNYSARIGAHFLRNNQDLMN